MTLAATDLLGSLTDAASEMLVARDGTLGGAGDWREEPVTLHEFVSGHLKLPPLFPRQEGAAERVLGAVPQETFTAEREFQMGVLLWGKGAGKDYLCSILIAYLVHVLLCLRDPQSYFGFGPGEAVDVLNVAYNADQAKRVFYAKLKQRVLGWQWLRDRYNVHEGGRLLGPRIPGADDVQINDDHILFPRHIRCFSRHAQNESYEGFNVIAWLMDEASAFLSKSQRENAEAIYQTLRTSAGSRFGRRWVGLIISYPRHSDDFTMTKHREAKADPGLGIYADGPASTWDVNDRIRDRMVEARPGHLVPEGLLNDYRADFEAAKSRYECDPPAARDAFFRYPDRLDACVAQGKRPLIEWEETVEPRTIVLPDGSEKVREFVGVKLTRLGELPKNTRVYFHGDPAVTSDAFALAVGHGVPATVMVKMPASEVLAPEEADRRGLAPDDFLDWEVDVTRTVIDGLILWRPDPSRDRMVDMENVKAVLLQLRKSYRIHAGSFDVQLGAADLIQTLQRKKVPVEAETWSNPWQLQVYRNARSCVYNDLVTLPDTPSVTSEDPLAPGVLHELKRVELIEARKIDHPEGGSKDLADAVCRVIYHACEHGHSGFAFGTAMGAPEKYGKRQALLPDTIGPRQRDPESPITDRLRELDAERQKLRPPGELSPANGRKFTSVPSR